MVKPTSKIIKEYLGDSYQPSDDQLISLYVETYDFYSRLQREIKELPLMMEHTNKASATNIVKNPLSIELTKTVQTLNNLLKSLGLTPAQRKTLKSGGEENDGFADF